MRPGETCIGFARGEFVPVLSVPVPPQRRRVLRATYPFAIAAVCLWFLIQRLDGVSLAGLGALAGTVGPLDWIAALAAAFLSFWAVGRYDALAHRHFGTGVPDTRARRAGVIAIAFSQTMGFGLATGAFARWQLLPTLTPGTALRLTLFVALSFLVALGTVICAVGLMLPGAAAMIPAVAAVAGLAAVAVLLACAFAMPELRLGRWSFRFPSLRAMAAIGGWTLVDTAAAALVLMLLMPSGAEIGFAALFPAYLLALGAALISGTPGGVGPFELAILALLPETNPEAVMAGIMAYRAVYFALPALIAGAILLAVHGRARKAPRPEPARAESLPTCATAETGLLRQVEGTILTSPHAALASLVTGQCLVGLFDPIRGRTEPSLALLTGAARDGNRFPCLYKAGARTTAQARRAGWHALRIAQEAILDPTRFDLTGRTHRQLRRKLRHAEKAGVRIERAGNVMPLAEMAALDQTWQIAHGTARGTTMGRFEARYVQEQAVFLAWQGDRLIGYVTFHTGARDWCLDLMRPAPDAPDGTMHALICAALAETAALGLSRLSLAALPDHPLARFAPPGLAQFKRSFAPRLEPRYLCAPGPLSLLLAAAEMARAVHYPAPLRTPPHELLEQNGFALPAHT